VCVVAPFSDDHFDTGGWCWVGYVYCG
jgi:hypothetical protein